LRRALLLSLVLHSAVTLAAPAARGKKAGRKTAQYRVIHRAMLSLGVPKKIARVYGPKGRWPAAGCSFFNKAQQRTTHVLTFHSAALGGMAYMYLEHHQERGLSDPALITRDAGRLLRTLYKRRYKPARSKLYKPEHVAVFARRGVRVEHYKFRPLVGDVLGALKKCQVLPGEAGPEFAVFFIRRKRK